MVAPQTFLSSSIFLVVLSLIASWYITYCFALQLIIEYLYRLVSFCTLLSVTRKYRYSLFLSNAYCLSFCFAKYSCKRHRFESPSHFHLIVASLLWIFHRFYHRLHMSSNCLVYSVRQGKAHLFFLERGTTPTNIFRYIIC